MRFVDVVSFLPYFIIIGRAEGTLVRGAVALQFSVNAYLSVAWLIYVRRPRLLIDEADHACLAHVGVRMEL